MSMFSNAVKIYGFCLACIGIFSINENLRSVERQLIILNKNNENNENKNI